MELFNKLGMFCILFSDLFDCSDLYRMFLMLNLRFLFVEIVLVFFFCMFGLLCVVIVFKDVL